MKVKKQKYFHIFLQYVKLVQSVTETSIKFLNVELL